MTTFLACVFTSFVLVATLWQAWRGYALQARMEHFRKMEFAQPWRARFLFALADGFTHGVLALTGWWSLWAAADKLLQLRVDSDPSAGGVAFAFGLGLFGLLGVTGQVPTILNLGPKA